MGAEAKPSIGTRLKWVLTGRPLTEDEVRAARAAGEPDPTTRRRFDVPWGRNVGGNS